ncbi:MAG: GNAT family N-acetyltransferase [Pirellulaceae bacterium]|nr:GNAT family N-acetyltransferase [Pirellulaceae bacterium]
MKPLLNFRAATADDQPGIINLINRVYEEYGDRICLEEADADLLDIQGFYLQQEGEFMVLEQDNLILGTHALLPLADQPGCCTFRRLYLDKSLRGESWGEQMMRWALERAATRGFQRVEFWSDTRFERAHRFFQRLGFQPDGRLRQMTDGLIDYQEYFFSRPLDDVSPTISNPQFDKAGKNVDHDGTNG